MCAPSVSGSPVALLKAQLNSSVSISMICWHSTNWTADLSSVCLIVFLHSLVKQPLVLVQQLADDLGHPGIRRPGDDLAVAVQDRLAYVPRFMDRKGGQVF